MRSRIAAAALLLALAASPAAAQAPFFQGKQIKVLVGFPPGGGTDLYGRVIADGLARHVEGKPARRGAEPARRRQRHRHEQLRQPRAARRHHRAHRHRPVAGAAAARPRRRARENLRLAGAGRDPDGADHLCLAADRLQVDQGPAQSARAADPRRARSHLDHRCGARAHRAEGKLPLHHRLSRQGRRPARAAAQRDQSRFAGDADLRAERAADGQRRPGDPAVRARLHGRRQADARSGGAGRAVGRAKPIARSMASIRRDRHGSPTRRSRARSATAARS